MLWYGEGSAEEVAKAERIFDDSLYVQVLNVVLLHLLCLRSPPPALISANPVLESLSEVTLSPSKKVELCSHEVNEEAVVRRPIKRL